MWAPTLALLRDAHAAAAARDDARARYAAYLRRRSCATPDAARRRGARACERCGTTHGSMFHAFERGRRVLICAGCQDKRMPAAAIARGDNGAAERPPRGRNGRGRARDAAPPPPPSSAAEAGGDRAPSRPEEEPRPEQGGGDPAPKRHRPLVTVRVRLLEKRVDADNGRVRCWAKAVDQPPVVAAWSGLSLE
jgi:hypothetical protein